MDNGTHKSHLANTFATPTQRGQTLVYCLHIVETICFYEGNNNNSHTPQLCIDHNRSFCSSNLCCTTMFIWVWLEFEIGTMCLSWAIVNVLICMFFYDITHYMHTKLFTKTISMGVNKTILNLNHNIVHKSMLLLANKIRMLKSHSKVGTLSVEMEWPLTFQDIFPLSPCCYCMSCSKQSVGTVKIDTNLRS